MSNILYIGEGKIEKIFIGFLKDSNFIRAGRFKQFNLLQNAIKDSDSILTFKADKIFAILDTDCIDDKFLNNLVQNIIKLRGISKNKVGLLIQNQNFEDELRYVLNCRDLGKFFKLKNQTTEDIKRYLSSNVNYSKCISREKLFRYCTRPEKFMQELNCRNITLPKAEFATMSTLLKK